MATRILVALLCLLLHSLVVLWTASFARDASILCITAIAAWAGLSCLQRVRRHDDAASGWIAIAIAMLLWSAGVLSHSSFVQMDATSPIRNPELGMVLFVLYLVPMALALGYAGDEPRRLRAVDGVLALVLSYLFFVATLEYVSPFGVPEEKLPQLRRMFDIGNTFILGFALLRWKAATSSSQRALFGTVAAYATVYLAVAYYINHIESPETDYGTPVDLVIAAPFLLLAVLSGRPESGSSPPSRSGGFAGVVQAASALVLPIALLLVSASLVTLYPVLAAIGFAITTLGYGTRAVLAQLHAAARLERLDALARVDALTGIANRRQFDETLQRECARARRTGEGVALLMVDLDHFKQINDRHGHPAGDACLRTVARILERCAARATDFVARYGGEEFALVLTATTEDAAQRTAESIRAAIETTSADAGAHIALTASIGLAFARSAPDDIDRWIALADVALYDAKRAGRNRVVLRRWARTDPVAHGLRPASAH